MFDIRDITVFGIDRAVNAVNNSFNVGEIDTTVKPNEKRVKVARALGKNNDELQSHDAWLAGCIVQFEMSCYDESLLRELMRDKFFEVSSLEDGSWFVTTNFRALKHFILRHQELKSFRRSIASKVERFTELTGVEADADAGGEQ